MFYGQRTNNGNGVNVNSKLYTSYSETAMVSLGGWNLQLSLKIHPFKGVNADGIRQYAQDNTEIVSTAITVDNATALLKGIEDKIKPALKEKSEASVSISMGSNENRKVLTISTDGNDVMLSVAVNVSAEGIADPSNIISHKFNKKSYMDGYNPSTGTGTEVVTNADFENFVKKLNTIYQFAPAVPHSINYNNALKASFSNNNAGNQSNGFQNAGYQAPTSNVGGGDFNAFLPNA